MFKKVLVVFSLLVAMGGAKEESNESENNKIIFNLILEYLKRAHYEPLKINDEFSQRVYDLYLKSLDYNKRFLTQEDLKTIEHYKTKIDDALLAEDYTIVEKTHELIKKRVDLINKHVNQILQSPMNLKTKETIQLDNEKVDYPKNIEDLKVVWNKSIKLQILNKILELRELDKTEKKKPRKLKALEAEARKKVRKTQLSWYKRLSQINYKDRRADFINAITTAFGPHTTYFPPKEKENFDIAMTGKLEGIGARLESKEGVINVVEIIPGSASARQGELKTGDKIFKVAQGIKDPVDVVDMRLDDAVKLIRGKKGTEVRLTVKKLNGTMKVIPIIRDVVIIEETYAKSLILEDKKNKKKYGYLYLPSFYTDFHNPDGRSCAKDVEKEVKKLKAQGMDALIFDLRNNGGGSLQDVVTIGGLFIDEGPIVQVKSKFGAPHILRDNDKGKLYDGPLFVMVNQFSASASEIFAAAMQDYNRAIVLGSRHSYGKGTVQQIVELDRFLQSYNLNSGFSIGALKFTSQKFYRINGGATQLKGVEPDIVLPDLYQFVDFGEGDQDYAMPWDKITPALYDREEMPYVKRELSVLSKKRISKDSIFQKIEENAKALKEQRENTVYPLNYDEYVNDDKRRKQQNEKFENYQVEINDLGVISLPDDLNAMKSDTSKVNRHNAWKDVIKKDNLLFETVNVASDFIKKTKKK